MISTKIRKIFISTNNIMFVLTFYILISRDYLIFNILKNIYKLLVYTD